MRMRVLYLASLGRQCCKSYALNLTPCSQQLLLSWGQAQLHQQTGPNTPVAPDAEQHQLPHANALMSHYQDLIQSDSLKPDAQQQACIVQLSKLCDQLLTYSHKVDDFETQSGKYQVRLASLRAELKRQEAEELARRQHQDAQRSTFWTSLLKRVQPEKASEQSPQDAAFLAAKERERKLQGILGPPPVPPPVPKGLYIYGSVGSGKSLLMDMFYTTLSKHKLVPQRRRMHFNAAMLELHTRLHKLEQERREQNAQKMELYTQQVALEQLKAENKDKAKLAQRLAELEDPVAQHQKLAKLAKLAIRRLGTQRLKQTPSQNSEVLAKSNAVILRGAAESLIRGQDNDVSLGWDTDNRRRAAVLCFDEVQVTDPFAAVALKGVMEALLEKGCIIVCTSNRAPWELNRHGLHEDLFGHFIQNLVQACEPFQLSAEKDYRRLLAPGGTAALGEHYFYPSSPDAQQALESKWQELTGTDSQPAGPAELAVMFGRRLQVGQASRGIARFAFDELCNRTLGAADYIAVAQAFHTVFLTDIPTMSLKVRDQARRFITLIDELYNNRVRLVCSADSPPDLLFAGNIHEEPIIDLEQLQFEAAVEGSRLRRNLLAEGGVAPVAVTAAAAQAATQNLGGVEEKFAFARAVSRLYEMQSDAYLRSRDRV